MAINVAIIFYASRTSLFSGQVSNYSSLIFKKILALYFFQLLHKTLTYLHVHLIGRWHGLDFLLPPMLRLGIKPTSVPFELFYGTLIQDTLLTELTWLQQHLLTDKKCLRGGQDSPEMLISRRSVTTDCLHPGLPLTIACLTGLLRPYFFLSPSKKWLLTVQPFSKNGRHCLNRITGRRRRRRRRWTTTLKNSPESKNASNWFKTLSRFICEGSDQHWRKKCGSRSSTVSHSHSTNQQNTFLYFLFLLLSPSFSPSLCVTSCTLSPSLVPYHTLTVVHVKSVQSIVRSSLRNCEACTHNTNTNFTFVERENSPPLPSSFSSQRLRLHLKNFLWQCIV